MKKESTILLLAWIGLIFLCLSFASCSVSLLPKGYKTETIKPVDSATLRRMDSLATIVHSIKSDSNSKKRMDSLQHLIDSIGSLQKDKSVDTTGFFNDYPFQDTTSDVQDREYWQSKCFEALTKLDKEKEREATITKAYEQSKAMLQQAQESNANMQEAYDQTLAAYKDCASKPKTQDNGPLAAAVTAVVMMLIGKIQAAMNKKKTTP